MKAFNLNFVRIEHQVFEFTIAADSEEEAQLKAEELMERSDFDWLDYEVVHAEEFWN